MRTHVGGPIDLDVRELLVKECVEFAYSLLKHVRRSFTLGSVGNTLCCMTTEHLSRESEKKE